MAEFDIFGNPDFITGGDATSEVPASPSFNMSAVISVLMVILVITLFYKVYSASKAKVKAIADAGWIVFYKKGCSHCDRQKQLLPGATYVECGGGSGPLSTNLTDKPPLSCTDPLIQGFPFWYNTKTKATKIGVQSDPRE